MEIDPLNNGQISNNDYYGNVTHTATVANLANPATYSFHDPVDADTVREITTRYDARHRPTARTVWLVPRGVVDPNNPPIAGLDGVPPSDGLTTRYYYDDNLTDALGLDGGLLVNKIDGSGSFTLNISQLLAELTADGISLGADSDGSAVVTLNGQDEISVSLSDGARRSVARGIIAQTGAPITWTSTLHDAIATLADFGDCVETAQIDALNHSTKSHTDGLGRSIETVDALANITASTYDAGGLRLTVRDPNNTGQDCTYDELGRRTVCQDTQEIIDSVQRSWLYDLSGNQIQATDAKGGSSTNAYDPRGRRSSSLDRNSSLTVWTYDPNSNLLALTDGENQTTTYTYDPANRRLSEQYPDHVANTAPGDADYGIVAIVYDAAHQFILRTDQFGDTRTIAYDLAGRRTQVDYRTRLNSPSGTTTDSDSITYDASNRILTAVSGRYNNTTDISYDAAGRVATESLIIGGKNYTLQYQNDVANRLTEVTLPDGTLEAISYSPRGQVTHIDLGAVPVVDFIWDAGGREQSRTYGNGIGSTTAYRADNLLSTILLPNITDFTYSYDANKNVVGETQSGTMANYSMLTGSSGFDPDDRLINWALSNGLAQSWTLPQEGDWATFTENSIQQTRLHGNAHEVTSIGGAPVRSKN